jgi:hypothetical protein
VITVVYLPLCGGADDDQLVLPPASGCQGTDTLVIEGRRVSPQQEAALAQTLPAANSIEVLDIRFLRFNTISGFRSKRAAVAVAGVAKAGSDEGGGGEAVIEGGGENRNVRMQAVEVFVSLRRGDDAEKDQSLCAGGLEL